MIIRQTLVKIKDAEAEADGLVEAYFAENILATLNKIMSALSASINNMNKTYSNSVFNEESKLAKASVNEICLRANIKSW